MIDKFDYRDHDDGGAALVVEPGSYICAIKSFQRKQRGRDTHLDVVTEIMVFCSGRDNSQQKPGDIVQGICWDTWVLEQRGLWRVAQFFKAIKAPTSVNLNSDADVARAVKLKPFLASIILDEYQGKVKNKIDSPFQIPSQYQQFAELAQPRIAELAPSRQGDSYGEPGLDDRASRPGGGQGHGGNDFHDDDIPF